MKTLRDTWLIYRRSVVLTLRQPVWVAMGMFQPVLYLLLFGPLLDGATGAAGATGSAFNWFVPGLLIMTGFFAAAFAGFGLVLVPGGIALTFVIVALVGLTFGLLSYTLALVFKSEDALAPVVQGLALPLLLLSGIFLPMTFAPDWLQTLSSLNPLTHAVDAARALFNGQWADPEIIVGSTV